LTSPPEPVGSALFSNASLLREILYEISTRLSVSERHLETNFALGQEEGLYVGWEFSGVGGVRAKTTSTNPTRFELAVGLAADFKTDIPAGENLSCAGGFCGLLQGRH